MKSICEVVVPYLHMASEAVQEDQLLSRLLASAGSDPGTLDSDCEMPSVSSF